MDTKTPVMEQPQVQTMAYKSETPGGEAEWQHDFFDCFSGADNLCQLLALRPIIIANQIHRPEGNFLLLLRIWQDSSTSQGSFSSLL
jgi:hypothetical protein